MKGRSHIVVHGQQVVVVQASHEALPLLVQPLLIAVLLIFQEVRAVVQLVIVRNDAVLAFHEVPHTAHVLFVPFHWLQHRAALVSVQFVLQKGYLLEPPFVGIVLALGTHNAALATIRQKLVHD